MNLIKRILSIAALLSCFTLTARAVDITIASFTTGPIYQSADSVVVLRLYYSDTFTDSNGVVVVSGAAGSQAFFKSVTCSLNPSTKVVTCPSFTMPSTIDSSRPTVTVTGVLFGGKSATTLAQRTVLFSNWRVPTTPTSTTYVDLNLYNLTKRPTLPDTYYTAAQVDQKIAQVEQEVGGGGDAQTDEPLSQFAATTSAQFAGVISDETGEDKVVLSRSPQLETPHIGIATATSVNKLIINEPASVATLGIANTKTFTVNNTVTIAATGDGFTFTIPGSGTPVLQTRTITEGVGLAGNTYDLSANRTIALGLPSSLSVSSSNSVVGTTHSHAITSSSNPGAAASLLASDASGHLRLVRLGIGVAPNVPLEVSGDILNSASVANLYLRDVQTGWQSVASTIVTPQANNSIRATSYTSGLTGWNISAAGNAEFNNVDVRGAIHAAIFTYNAISATAGTLGVFKSACKLRSDVSIPSSPTYGTTTVNIDCVDADGLAHGASQLFAAGDVLRLKDGLVGDTWLTISSASDQATFWRYVATIQAGTNNVSYRAGLGVADYGPTGQGFIIQTADQTNSPYLQMATHAATFSSANSSGTLNLTPRLRIGNLNGSYGFATDTFGFGAGPYGVAGQSWVIVDSTNGVRIGNNVTTKISLNTSGDASFTGSITAASGTIGNWTINSTSLTNNQVKIAAGVDVNGVAGTGEAWFGKSATGYYGLFIKGTTAASLTLAAGNSAVGAAGRPYLNLFDGTRYRVVIGELNWTGWDGVATNSMGMKIWDSSGNKLVEFSDVQNTIAGLTVTATRASVGTGSSTAGLDSTATGGDDVRIFAGNATPSSAPFRVTEAGALTATSGNVGGWTLGSTSLTSGSGSSTVGLDSGGSNPAFYAGSATPGSAPFRVTNAGALTASNVAITAGAGSVLMNSSGITLTPGSTADGAWAILWKSSGTKVGGLQSYNFSNPSLQLDYSFVMESVTKGTANEEAWAQIVAHTPSDSKAATLIMKAVDAAAGAAAWMYGVAFNGLAIGTNPNSGPNAMLDVRGNAIVVGDLTTNSIQLVTGSRPTCNSGNRFKVWAVAGGAGVADTFEVCRKDAADSYAWSTLY